MKAKLTKPYEISLDKTIIAGSECEILDAWCGCEGNYYLCDFGENLKISINANILEITDRSPIINWEEIRIKAAIASMEGMMMAISPERFTIKIKPEVVAKASVEYADALIKELKNKEETSCK